MQTDRKARIDSPSRRLPLSLRHRETTRWPSWFGDDWAIDLCRENPGRSLWFAIRTLLTGSAMCVLLVSASHAIDIELTEIQNDIRELIRRQFTLAVRHSVTTATRSSAFMDRVWLRTRVVRSPRPETIFERLKAEHGIGSYAGSAKELAQVTFRLYYSPPAGGNDSASAA